MVAPRVAALVTLVLLAPASPHPSWAEGPPDHARPTLPPEAQRVAFRGPAGSAELMKGFLYVPTGKGPFPAVLWNHGSEALPGWQPELARFYNRQGFVFFIPHRRGQGQSPGSYIVDRVEAIASQMKDRADGERRFIALQEEAALDVEAALAALKRLPEVDPNRIVMSGVSFGGIQTLLAAEKGLGVRAFVAFAPGAMAWGRVSALGERLRRAVKGAKAPVLVLQAENDYDLAPARALDADLRRRGDGSAAKVYPAFGQSHQDGHGAFAITREGTAIWGAEVVSFFKQGAGIGNPSPTVPPRNP
jgi:carboxymethylenebutenolidase